MHPALVIAGKDLRQRLRDRSAIVLGFVAPLAIAALMSAAFSATQDYHAKAGLVVLDRGEVATSFARLLATPEISRIVSTTPYADVASARRAVDSGRVDTAFVVPAGFTAAVVTGAPADISVLGSVDSSVAAQVARSIAESFVMQVNAQRLAVGAAIASGAPATSAAALAHRAASVRVPVEVVTRAVGDRRLKTISYYAPGMGIFFVLFAIGFGARGWFLEKAAGTLDRMAAAPIGSGTLLVGKALATFGYALASLLTMAVVSTLAFGADWGDPIAVGTLCVAMAVAVVALTVLVTAVARTERQVDAFASLLTFSLAIVGGNFVFASMAPPLLRRLALLTPNGWALRGFTDLGTGTRGWDALAGPLAGIAVFTAVVAVVAAAAARRAVPR